MLSYQHIYHAGSFADVHKHALLAKILTVLKNRHPRLWALDTHAGRGVYDLASAEAQKTMEYRNGIAAFQDAGGKDSPIVEYTEAVARHAPLYPGSARLLCDILRATDSLTLAELHPGEYGILVKNFAAAPHVKMMNTDGPALLEGSMPPPVLTGIAVIDPSYEIKTEYAEVPKRIHQAYKKWPKGVFFLWYPILKTEPHRDMLIALRKSGMKNILVNEISLKDVPEEGFAMRGSGVVLINSPLPEAVIRAASEYTATLLPGQAAAETYWLDNMAIDKETGTLR